MELQLLSKDAVLALHAGVLNPAELRGLAGDKSLDGVLGRVINRLEYGLIGDVFDLAAAYACVLAVGHVFNDGNKRTAYAAMDMSLAINGIEMSVNPIDVADLIIQAAQGIVDEAALARWLRSRA